MRSRYLAILRICFASLTLIAIGTQLIRHINYSFSVVNFFSYFTNLSNIFISIVFLIGSVIMLTTKKEPKAFAVLRGAAVLAMVIVGIVFAILLRGEDLGTLHPWVNDVLHYVMPIAALADWLLVPAATLAYRTLWYWLIFPLVYVTYSLVRGARSHWYAYPFFNPAKHGYAGITLYCIGICVAFLVFGIILILLTHRRKLRSNHA